MVRHKLLMMASLCLGSVLSCITEFKPSVSTVRIFFGGRDEIV